MKWNKKFLNRIAILFLLILASVIVVIFFNKPLNSKKEYTVTRAKFVSAINCKGEIQGKTSTEIKLPDIICDRELRLWELKIGDMVQEGKYVKKGEFIIQLTPDNILSNMRQRQQELEKASADLKNAVIDSTVKLSQMREEITNAFHDLEYKKIDLELAKYESAAYQRQSEMAYEKSTILLNNKKRDLLLEKNKQKLIVVRLEEKVNKLKSLIEKFNKALQAARITTPENGIVMFAKKWDGKKYKKDDPVWTYFPILATLPDMSKVISEVFVKEIDISKIAVGDSALISIDAIPNKKLPGKIISIASIGESHKDFDMQVFKVIIELDETHKELKPGMTSNNDIVIANFEDILQVPLDAVFSRNGDKYVYMKEKSGTIIKRNVSISYENEEMAAIKSGLNEGDIILLEEPEDAEKLAII